MIMDDMYFSQLDMLWNLFSKIPNATARIRGNESHPQIKGLMQLYQLPQGVLIVVEVMGLPSSKDSCKSGIHGLHIHDGTRCTGNEADPFANAGTHYNPKMCAHPHHAGDLPPLLENQGYAMSVFYTERFRVNEVLGKTVIVHDKADDFTSQPAGDSGNKIACGEIRALMLN